MANKKTELKKILLNISKSENSLKEIRDLYLKAKKILGTELTSEELALTLSIFEKGALWIGKFMEKWIRKNIRPTDEELDLLEKAFDEGSKVFNLLAENSLITKEVNKVNQKKLQDSADMVQQEKTLRRLEKQLKDKKRNSSQNSNSENDSIPSRSSSSPSNSNSNPNIQNNNNQEIQALQSQISSLQNSINKLETNNQSPNSTNNQQDKQEFENLKKQLAELQTKLKSLQNKPNKSDISNDSFQPKELTENAKPKNEFNWLYLIIPGGVLILVMGIVIAYLVGKKSNKQ